MFSFHHCCFYFVARNINYLLVVGPIVEHATMASEQATLAPQKLPHAKTHNKSTYF